jgi:membrane protein YqaA with SNARE-associated domain
MESRKINIIVRVLVMIFVVVLSVVLVTYREKISSLERFGYSGIFLISVLSNASLLLPVPGLIFTSSMGAVFNPFWVAVAAGSGAAVGEISGYLAGYSGQMVVERRDLYQKIKKWMDKFGGLTLLVLAFIPNPLFDVAGIAAGMLKIPLWYFLTFCVIGKILKMLIFAYGGATIIKLLM